MRLSGGSGSAGGPSVLPVFFSLDCFCGGWIWALNSWVTLDTAAGMESSKKGGWILCILVWGKVGPLHTSYHPATKLLVFQMASTDDTIRELSLLTTCSAWNSKLEATPTCTEIFPFFRTLQYSVYGLQVRNAVCVRNKLQLGRICRGLWDIVSLSRPR